MFNIVFLIYIKLVILIILKYRILEQVMENIFNFFRLLSTYQQFNHSNDK